MYAHPYTQQSCGGRMCCILHVTWLREFHDCSMTTTPELIWMSRPLTRTISKHDGVGAARSHAAMLQLCFSPRELVYFSANPRQGLDLPVSKSGRLIPAAQHRHQHLNRRSIPAAECLHLS